MIDAWFGKFKVSIYIFFLIFNSVSFLILIK
jgi:hypothetical protein